MYLFIYEWYAKVSGFLFFLPTSVGFYIMMLSHPKNCFQKDFAKYIFENIFSNEISSLNNITLMIGW